MRRAARDAERRRGGWRHHADYSWHHADDAPDDSAHHAHDSARHDGADGERGDFKHKVVVLQRVHRLQDDAHAHLPGHLPVDGDERPSLAGGSLQDAGGVLGSVTGSVQPGATATLNLVIGTAEFRRLTSKTTLATTLTVTATDAAGNGKAVSSSQRLRAQ